MRRRHPLRRGCRVNMREATRRIRLVLRRHLHLHNHNLRYPNNRRPRQRIEERTVQLRLRRELLVVSRHRQQSHTRKWAGRRVRRRDIRLQHPPCSRPRTYPNPLSSHQCLAQLCLDHEPAQLVNHDLHKLLPQQDRVVTPVLNSHHKDSAHLVAQRPYPDRRKSPPPARPQKTPGEGEMAQCQRSRTRLSGGSYSLPDGKA